MEPVTGHEIEVRPNPHWQHYAPDAHRAFCSCGWSSITYQNAEAALKYASFHLESTLHGSPAVVPPSA